MANIGFIEVNGFNESEHRAWLEGLGHTLTRYNVNTVVDVTSNDIIVVSRGVNTMGFYGWVKADFPLPVIVYDAGVASQDLGMATGQNVIANTEDSVNIILDGHPLAAGKAAGSLTYFTDTLGSPEFLTGVAGSLVASRVGDVTQGALTVIEAGANDATGAPTDGLRIYLLASLTNGFATGMTSDALDLSEAAVNYALSSLADVSDTLYSNEARTIPFTTANVKYAILNTAMTTLEASGTFDPEANGTFEIPGGEVVAGDYVVAFSSADGLNLGIEKYTVI